MRFLPLRGIIFFGARFPELSSSPVPSPRVSPPRGCHPPPGAAPLRSIVLLARLPPVTPPPRTPSDCDVQENAALSKDLNDKTSVLAGVKEKTKAYVEKLNSEKAAAVASLMEQVGG